MELKYRNSATHNIYPNITVEEGYYEEAPDVIVEYRVTPNEGYVFYDPSEIHFAYNPETDEMYPVFHYYRLAYLIPNYNFANFPYVAVLESEVPADHIFGGGDSDHETV